MNPASTAATPILTLNARQAMVAVVALAITAAGLGLPQGLSGDGQIALTVSGLAILGWVGTRLPESLVALVAVMALVLSGVLTEEQLFAALGAELIWLLLAAFVIAAVAKQAGLIQRMVAPLLRRGLRFGHFALALTLAIVATAFVLPSTSGRAALLLPVFAAVATALPDPRLVRPLALLFPTVILLSAGASLIGAGAHLLAAQAIRNATGLHLGYLDWAMLGLPFSLLASLIGTGLIVLIFVPRELRMARLPQIPTPPATPQDLSRQRRIGMVLAGVIALWLTADWHGIGMALSAMLGALVLLTRPFTTQKPKEVFRAVDVELLLYMSATVLIAQAMTATGTDRWLADHALRALPAQLSGSLPAVAVLLSVVAVLAHVAITSRSARAAVLIPAVALPVAGLGHDPALMILIAVIGTGFCQSMMASAKPVAMFGNAEGAGFTQADLMRLSLPLAPAVTALLVGFALLIWPAQLAGLRDQSDAPIAAARAPATLVAGAVALTPAPAPIIAARPLPRPPELTAAAPRAKARPRGAAQLQRDLNRVLRPAGLRIVIR